MFLLFLYMDPNHGRTRTVFNALKTVYRYFIAKKHAPTSIDARAVINNLSSKRPRSGDKGRYFIWSMRSKHMLPQPELKRSMR
ncbi:hypothetical protein TMES_11270 [Thalassospira mesophila]|uniref:Uncharacterized protein n=1 Tax=Thalassospira mesophila TaxID=1293891 RepID=A0A1Y2L096_9PROT|nr:hypothetical protein TMES_11270 [Thalassospira mesophila]